MRHSNARETKMPCPTRSCRVVTFERLEERLALSTSYLSSCVYSAAKLTSFTTRDPYEENYSGVALYSVGNENRMVIPVNRHDTVSSEPPALVEYAVNSNYSPIGGPRRIVTLQGFRDVEGIVHMGAGEFAIVEEDRADISRFVIPDGGADFSITKGAPGVITINVPPPLELPDGNNKNMEGLAFVPPSDAPAGFPQGLFFLGREELTQSIYRIDPATNSSLLLTIDGLAAAVKDISDLFYRGNDLFVATEKGSTSTDDKIIRIALNSAMTEGTMTGDRFPPAGTPLNHNQVEGVAFSPDGSQLIVVGEQSPSSQFAVYDVKLQVAQVVIGSIGTGGHGDYAVPSGSGEQIRTVPVGGVGKIKVTFNKGVNVDLADLSVVGVSTTPPQTYNVTGFSYDSAAQTATWTLGAAVAGDQLELTLNAAGITDAAGNALDGEWINPTTLGQTSSDVYPSGDGTAGGDFVFHVTVMPDFDRNNIAGFADLGTLLNNYNMPGGFYQGDITGDGEVNFADLGTLLNYYNFDWTSWPTGGGGLLMAPSNETPATSSYQDRLSAARADVLAFLAAGGALDAALINLLMNDATEWPELATTTLY